MPANYDHILLFRPPDPLQDSALLSHTRRPMNLAYLAAMLRTAGFTVAIIDYETTPFSEQHLCDVLQTYQPLVAGITALLLTARPSEANRCR